MQTYAAIDIGSNSCRLKIARVVQHRLKVLHEDRVVTRLGASVFESGLISPQAMADTLATLKRFYRAVQEFGADQVRAVATSAMRDARNARAFQAWIRDETGWEVEIISGLEEGRLIHSGVMENEDGGGGALPAYRRWRRQLRDFAFTTQAHQGHDQPAAGRGAADGGVSDQRSADRRGHCADEAVHRPRAAARRAAEYCLSGQDDHCDLRDGGRAGRGEQIAD